MFLKVNDLSFGACFLDKLELELKDDLRGFWIWLNNSSVYTGDWNISHHCNIYTFLGEKAPKLMLLNFEHPVYIKKTKTWRVV